MKTNIKNIIVLMLAMLLVLGLTACGSKTSDKQPSTDSNIVNIPGTAEPRTDAPVDETPAAPADETPEPVIEPIVTGGLDYDDNTSYTWTFVRDTGVVTFEGKGELFGFETNINKLGIDYADIKSIVVKGDFTDFDIPFSNMTNDGRYVECFPNLESVDLSGAPSIKWIEINGIGTLKNIENYNKFDIIYSGNNLDEFAENEKYANIVNWIKK